MTSPINPSNIPPSFSNVPSPAEQKELTNQMEALIEELRSAIGPPMNEDEARQVALNLESFLTMHKQELFAIAQANGYPPTGAYNYVNEYNACINGIRNFLQNPTEPSLYIINEGLTQLTYFLTHPHIKH